MQLQILLQRPDHLSSQAYLTRVVRRVVAVFLACRSFTVHEQRLEFVGSRSNIVPTSDPCIDASSKRMLVNSRSLTISGGDVYVCPAMRPECAGEEHCCHRDREQAIGWKEQREQVQAESET